VFQEAPVILAGNDEQKKKYLTRMTEEPLYCVRIKLNLVKNLNRFNSVKVAYSSEAWDVTCDM